jgi:hypothetical protein
MPVESGVDGLPASQGTLGGTVRSISTSISPTRRGWRRVPSRHTHVADKGDACALDEIASLRSH